MTQQQLLDNVKAHLKLMADRNKDGKVNIDDAHALIDRIKSNSATVDAGVQNLGHTHPWLLVAMTALCTSGLWYVGCRIFG